MPIYEHKCESCGHLWEDLFKLSDPIPDECPACGANQIKRVPSWVSGRVELTGRDLTTKLKSEANQERQKVYKDEKLLANLVGEERYHRNQLKG